MCSDAASNFYWKTFEVFIVFYYTDVFGLSALDVGTMLLVTRTLDAVADPLMGAVADPIGRRRASASSGPTSLSGSGAAWPSPAS